MLCISGTDAKAGEDGSSCSSRSLQNESLDTVLSPLLHYIQLYCIIKCLARSKANLISEFPLTDRMIDKFSCTQSLCRFLNLVLKICISTIQYMYIWSFWHIKKLWQVTILVFKLRNISQFFSWNNQLRILHSFQHNR